MNTEIPDHQNIILIGMPAVGKSTLGVLLAKRMSYAFLDTDLIIQSGEKTRLYHIIQQIGVDQFCDLEAQYVEQIAAHHTVIATGGSVIYRSQAMTHLKALGCIVFLDIQLTPLIKRLNDLDGRGVVRLPGQNIEELYKQRRPLYQQYAQLTIDCTNCSPKEAVQKMYAKLRVK